MNPITVIVPTLNDDVFIERTLCSVLDQTAIEVELIIVDRGSHKQARDMIDLYRDDVHAVINAPGATLGTAINRAVSHANGDFVTVLQSGDMLMPTALETIHQATTQHPQANWFMGDNLRLDEYDQMRGNVHPSLPPSLASYLMHDAGIIPSAGVFWKRELIDLLGGFDADLEYAYAYDLWCRLLLDEQMPVVLSATLATCRQYDHNDVQETLRAGEQYIHVAQQYAKYLSWDQCQSLRDNCEQRQHIFDLARHEYAAKQAA